MAPRYSLGVDLGTSNSAIAFSDVESDQTEILEITQILGPNRIGEKPTLPSALYIPHAEEFPAGAFPLPWRTAGGADAIVGHFARDHGALVPDRLIASAKSWLSNRISIPGKKYCRGNRKSAKRSAPRSKPRASISNISEKASSMLCASRVRL